MLVWLMSESDCRDLGWDMPDAVYGIGRSFGITMRRNAAIPPLYPNNDGRAKGAYWIMMLCGSWSYQR